MLRQVGVAALCLLSGCIHDYECVGGATRVDGRCVRDADAGTDGSADPVPSTPEVIIQPALPTTQDALRAVVVRDSEDPLGAAVELRYEWLLDGSSAGLTDQVVPADRTAKHQTWTVHVTPIAGSRMGASAEASITVVNTPPVVRSVGASSYAPRLDDPLRAVPAGVTDPDGDSTTYAYRWLRGDTPIEEIGSDVLDLVEHGFSAGDQVSVDVRANDGEVDGPAFRLGPLEVRAAVTAWVPRLPNRVPPGEGLSFAVHDPVHDRVVWYSGGELWEFPLNTQRWARLWPDGSPPDLVAASVAYDRASQRVVVVGGIERSAFRPSLSVYSVSLERGREEWTQLTVGGEVPPPWYRASVAVDEARDRLLVYGNLGLGLEMSSPLQDELWTLDLREGFETWERVELTGAAPGFIAGGSWIIEPGTDVAWLAGGMRWDPDTMSIAGGGDQIWRLDLLTSEFSQLAERLPVRLAGATAVFDPLRRRALLLGGWDESDAPYEGVIEFNVTAGTWTETAADSPFPLGGFARASWDDRRDLFLVTGEWPELSITTLSADLDWSALEVSWVSGPGALAGSAVGHETDSMLVIGGSGAAGEAKREVLRYSFVQGSFAVVDSIAPDPEHGTPPPTANWGLWGGEPSGEVLLFGGAGTLDTHDPPSAWGLAGLGGAGPRWHLYTLTAGSPSPSARSGAVVAGNDCFDTQMTVLGGRDGDTGATLDDLWYLHDCNSAGRECTWSEIPDSVLRPSARTGASAAGRDLELLVFGGYSDGASGNNDLWQGNACTPSLGFTQLMPAGSPPPARWGHTMTYNRAASGAAPRYYVFGGKTWGVDYSDVWLLEPSPWRWTEVEVVVDADHPAPAGRWDHVASWDRRRHRLVIFGGISGTTPRNDLWELRIVD